MIISNFVNTVEDKNLEDLTYLERPNIEKLAGELMFDYGENSIEEMPDDQLKKLIYYLFYDNQDKMMDLSHRMWQLQIDIQDFTEKSKFEIIGNIENIIKELELLINPTYIIPTVFEHIQSNLCCLTSDDTIQNIAEFNVEILCILKTTLRRIKRKFYYKSISSKSRWNKKEDFELLENLIGDYLEGNDQIRTKVSSFYKSIEVED